MRESRTAVGARKEYLAALGLDSWVLRGEVGVASAEIPSGTSLVPAPALAPASLDSAPVPKAVTHRGPPDVPSPTAARPAAASPLVRRTRETLPDHTLRESDADWSTLAERVAACERCGLSATRTNTVFGVGDRQADWLVVGEAPGADEDKQGEPFVGRAGQLLNSMLRAIGLPRERVYIANVLKCRPPQNRDPQAVEVGECLPYLERQIALLRPKIMLVVGRIAAQNLLRTDVKIGQLRQQVHQYGVTRVPLVVTYHPAYLLRSPLEKRKAWEDLKFAREVFARG